MNRPRMFATYLGDKPLVTGELALVEVPDNCTIHSIDAARLARLRSAATELRRAIGQRAGTDTILALAGMVAEFADPNDSEEHLV